MERFGEGILERHNGFTKTDYFYSVELDIVRCEWQGKVLRLPHHFRFAHGERDGDLSVAVKVQDVAKSDRITVDKNFTMLTTTALFPTSR